MATVADYEDRRAAIVFAFADALRIIRTNDKNDRSDDGEALGAAFDVAKAHGWDYATDDDFTSWCLKATEQEICVEGLRKALTEVG